MTSELLERATRALRASSAPASVNGARLEQAIERLQRAQRAPARSPLGLRTAAWTLAATLAGAGAWAHATGRVQWFASAPEPAAPVVLAPSERAARPEARRAPAPAPELPPEPREEAAEVASEAETAVPAPLPVAPEVRAPAREAPRSRAVEPVPPPASADELYRAAHAAHFRQQDYAAALQAWERYLAAAGPAHRWIVEARFNRGVALFRLGQKEAARRALRPFAEGEYGSYRRSEAAQLLEALRSAR